MTSSIDPASSLLPAPVLICSLPSRQQSVHSRLAWPTPVSTAEVTRFYYILFVLQKQDSGTIWGWLLCEQGRWGLGWWFWGGFLWLWFDCFGVWGFFKIWRGPIQTTANLEQRLWELSSASQHFSALLVISSAKQLQCSSPKASHLIFTVRQWPEMECAGRKPQN